jgi:hypothetical protein
MATETLRAVLGVARVVFDRLPMSHRHRIGV